MTSNQDFSGNNLNGDMDASLSLGGLFFEYICMMESPILFSIPLNILVEGVSIEESETELDIESSGIFILEPGIN